MTLADHLEAAIAEMTRLMQAAGECHAIQLGQVAADCQRALIAQRDQLTVARMERERGLAR